MVEADGEMPSELLAVWNVVAAARTLRNIKFRKFHVPILVDQNVSGLGILMDEAELVDSFNSPDHRSRAKGHGTLAKIAALRQQQSQIISGHVLRQQLGNQRPLRVLEGRVELHKPLAAGFGQNIPPAKHLLEHPPFGDGRMRSRLTTYRQPAYFLFSIFSVPKASFFMVLI